MQIGGESISESKYWNNSADVDIIAAKAIDGKGSVLHWVFHAASSCCLCKKSVINYTINPI